MLSNVIRVNWHKDEERRRQTIRKLELSNIDRNSNTSLEILRSFRIKFSWLSLESNYSKSHNIYDVSLVK